jgi:general secretion pathway protein E
MQESSLNVRKSFGELLVAEKLLTQEQLNAALKQQRDSGGRLEDVLLSLNLLKAEDLAAMQSVYLNLPYIDLQRHKIQPESLKLIPESVARKGNLIPLDVVGDSLMIVMADPQDIQAIQDLQAQVKMKVQVAIGVAADIRRAIDLNYRSSAEIEKKVQEFTPVAVEESSLANELTATTPIAQTVDLIITQAVRDRASDIHIEPQEHRLRIRFRIDGTLYDMFSLPLSAHVPLVSRIKILSDMNIAEQRRPQDGQMTVTVGEKQIDIRVASLLTAYGERMALRILDKSLALYTLQELGLTAENLQKFKLMANAPYGLFLVGGPTGSGKTTSLYALLNSLNRAERNIMTIEDPIEYHFEDINQTQVNVKAGLTFPAGLRAIMRHDPNIILIGEIRDQETASIAVQSALTGHLVLSSIHANNAVGVLFRLLDLGVEPFLIVSTLIGISTQRMVKKLCNHCKRPYKPDENQTRLFQEEIAESPGQWFTKGPGCNLCAKTGYSGRTGIFEIMLITDTIRRMIINGANAVDIEQQALQEGLVSMRKDGLRKVQQGIIPIEEVLRSVFTLG